MVVSVLTIARTAATTTAGGFLQPVRGISCGSTKAVKRGVGGRGKAGKTTTKGSENDEERRWKIQGEAGSPHKERLCKMKRFLGLGPAGPRTQTRPVLKHTRRQPPHRDPPLARPPVQPDAAPNAAVAASLV